MSLWGKAIISGILVGGILFSLFFIVGGEGGRSLSPVGFVLLLAHFPVVWLGEMMFGMGLPDGVNLSILFSLSSVMWILLSYAFLVTRDRK